MKRIASLTLFGLLAFAFAAFATPPVATPSFGQTWEDTEGEVVLNYHDDDGDLATECNVFLVDGGTVLETSVVEGVCTVTIMPDLNNDVNVTGLFNVVAGGEVSNDATFTLDLIDVNDPPVIISEPPLTGQFGEFWIYQLIVDDPEDDYLHYELRSDVYWGPDMGDIDQEGLIEWGATVRGPIEVTVTVTDDGWTNDIPEPQFTQQVFTIIIQPCITYYEFDNSDPQFGVLSGWWGTIDLPLAINGSVRFHPPAYHLRAGWRVDQVVEPGIYDIYTWRFPTGHDQILAEIFCYGYYYALGYVAFCGHPQDMTHGQWMCIGRLPIDPTIPQGVVLMSMIGGYVYIDAVRYIKVNEWPTTDDSILDEIGFDGIPGGVVESDSLAIPNELLLINPTAADKKFVKPVKSND